MDMQRVSRSLPGFGCMSVDYQLYHQSFRLG
jgi:hypothetical protein